MTQCPLSMSPEQCKQLVDDMREIKGALIGNDKMGQVGLVQKVENHEKRIGRMERYIVYLSGAAATIGILYTFVKDFIK